MGMKKVELQDGSTRWEIDYYEPTHGGKRRRKRTWFKTKKEADGELANRKSLIAENRYLDVNKNPVFINKKYAVRAIQKGGSGGY